MGASWAQSHPRGSSVRIILPGCIIDGWRREGRNGMLNGPHLDYAASGVASVINVAPQDPGFMDIPAKGLLTTDDRAIVVHRSFIKELIVSERIINGENQSVTTNENKS